MSISMCRKSPIILFNNSFFDKSFFQQSTACLAEFEQNDKFYGQDLPKVMGFNFFFGQTEGMGKNYEKSFWVQKINYFIYIFRSLNQYNKRKISSFIYKMSLIIILL